MIKAVLQGVCRMGKSLAASLPRRTGGGCGVHFDADGVHFVRLTRIPGPARLRVDAHGAATLEDGMLRGAALAKPEAVARRLGELLERLGMTAQAMCDDVVVTALPAHGLRTQVVDCPDGLPPRAFQAWCERRAALLLPGDGDPDLRSRVGVTWAEPGSHRLRLYACDAELADDRVAVLEMAGLRVHAIDAAHEAGRRAFRWARPPDEDATASGRRDVPVALLQVDSQALDFSAFDGQVCVAHAQERFDGADGSADALAGVVRRVWAKLPVAPGMMYLATSGASPAALVAICDALAAACGVPVRPFDPLRRFGGAATDDPRRPTFAQRTALAVPCGLALRAMTMQGVPCD